MNATIRSLVTGFLLSVAVNAFADLTTAQWVDIDLDTRALTVDGMAQRLALLTRGANQQEQMDADSITQAKVGEVYARHNTTPEGHLRWAAAHRAEIDTWMEAHPEKSAQLLEVQLQFEQLSEQLQSATGNQ
jgi:hypothetical protein